MRASDADRDAVLTELSEHFQAGRLTSDEFDERSSKALAAKTYADLAGLVTDLPDTSAPTAPPPQQQPVAGPLPGPRPPVRRGGSRVSPLAIAAVVIVAYAVLGSHQQWHLVSSLWWVVIIALVVARRGMRRR